MDHSIEPGSIVVGVDGSEHAERAVHWAAEQAELEGRRLVVVSTGGVDAARADERMGVVDAPVDGMQSLLHSATAIATAGVALAERSRPGLTVEALPTVGDPREVLVDLSREAHLIVLGSHGRGPLRSLLLGSVSAAVTKHAACPVVVCRPRRRHDSPRGVLVGADATPESLPVIEFAFEHASRRGQPLTVLHCFWDVVAAVAAYRGMSADELDEPEFQELRMVLSESVAGLREKYPDVPVSLDLRHGLVDEALSRREQSWDLVVVGRHPVDSLPRLLTGSISTTVLERAHTAVAVVPEAPSSS